MRIPSLISPPPPIWRESRLAFEIARLVRDPVYRGEGVEDAGGQPVLLIPGFLAGDDSLGVMTKWLRRTGHHTRKAGIRANVGCSETTIERLVDRVELLAEVHEQKVAIIGQSRGGCIARVLAVRRPDLVSGIVALGSPIVEPFAIHPVVRLHVIAVGALGTLGAPGMFGNSCRNGECCERFWEDLAGDFPKGVGFLSLYSKSDGVVNWRACLDPAATNVEIEASHVGMAVNVHAYQAIARALEAYHSSAAARRGSDRRAGAPDTLRRAA
jgi:pimeloyl-ACP methyl ester carboxylesterase